MGIAAKVKKTPIRQPSQTPSASLLGRHEDDALFLRNTLAATGMTRKEYAYIMGVSKTHVDNMLSGSKRDPIARVRRFCDEAKKRGHGFVVASILLRIAGHDFGGMILDNDQAEMLRKFTQLIMGPRGT